MNQVDIIERTKSFVQETLSNAEGGHDWFHTLRVFNTSIHLAKQEKVDVEVVALAALLHDIADSKFHDGDETVGPNMARAFLFKENVDSEVIEHVIKIIENISYKSSLDGEQDFNSKELEVVRDADRLDAMGAIGIARCFNFGGFKNRKLYDPEIEAVEYANKEDYKKSESPSINHFYEKLLKLKDLMHTKTAKKMAKKRHRYMQDYLDRFFDEWHGRK